VHDNVRPSVILDWFERAVAFSMADPSSLTHKELRKRRRFPFGIDTGKAERCEKPSPELIAGSDDVRSDDV